MEFGMVDAAELDHIDFALPPDPSENNKVLSTSNEVPKMLPQDR